MPTERTVLIDKGVLTSYMVDRWGALKTGYRRTGSGRRENYTYAPTSRMRNTFIVPGDVQDASDLFAGIELRPLRQGDGRRPGQARLGRVQLRRHRGLRHPRRRGRRARARRDARRQGPDTIKKVDAVATDLSTEPGMCGSLSGSIPTEVGQPHLRVSEIVVGGEA
jgi:TldD protein